MLSARGEEYDKLFGFEIGIDDYVVKPFSPKEIMARLNVIVSRNKKIQNDSNSNEIYEFDGLVIDMLGRNVFVDEVKVDMTSKGI